MLKGSATFGKKVEVKNMNSARNVKRAIEFEVTRQVERLEKGLEITQETRSFDARNGSTISMRSKESANDYRYFPEPDLQPIIINESYIQKIKKTFPLLPRQLFSKFTKKFNLSEYDASILIEDKSIALYFNELCKYTNHYKIAANYINGCIKSYLNEKAEKIENLNVSFEQLAELIMLVKKGKISSSVATQKIFPLLLKNEDSPSQIAIQNNWIQESNTDAITNYIKIVTEKYPNKVKEYREGKKGLIGFFMGEVMKLSQGKVDPKLANKLLEEQLEK